MDKFEPEFLIFLNDKYFDSVYSVEYYDSKKEFFDTGIKQFFIIYQILKNGGFEVTIEEKATNCRSRIKNEAEFEQWVTLNYPMFKDFLYEW